jgi:hypothetical protein
MQLPSINDVCRYLFQTKIEEDARISRWRKSNRYYVSSAGGNQIVEQGSSYYREAKLVSMQRCEVKHHAYLIVLTTVSNDFKEMSYKTQGLYAF